MFCDVQIIHSLALQEPIITNATPAPGFLPRPPNLQELVPRTPSPKPEIQVFAPTFKIKRIKLLVKRPPPALTNPRQRPPPPKFNSSLSAFLASYRTLGDDSVNDESLSRRVLKEARIREQEAAFRRQGRFIPGTDVLFGTQPNTTPYDPPKRTTRDAWDDIVEIVCATRGKIPKTTLGQQVTAQIASKVRAYWDTQELKRGKAKAQEEKRLRALAKAAMKMVNTEWKRVVHVCSLYVLSIITRYSFVIVACTGTGEVEAGS